jgi:hypothetical protein
MGSTVPAWLEITAAVILGAGCVAFVAWVIVLWVVRLRFPFSEDEPRLAPRGDDLVLQLLGPVRRVTREAVEPSAHQPAARRPAWRVPAGPWSPDGTAVTFRTARAGLKPEHRAPLD